MRQEKVVEWYEEVDGPEDNSPMDTNQCVDVYQMETVRPERLEDGKDVICLKEVQAN